MSATCPISHQLVQVWVC